ncbi:MAG TPA: HAMP domain-containing sensor histidine kinase [Polyangia bacterium]|nr:HAMP domain-containing sensor histidine kinase [Polyangia bacterium]
MQTPILERLTQLLLPEFGECSALVVMDDEGRVVDRAVAHVDAGKRESVLALSGCVADSTGPLHHTFLGGTAMVIADLSSADGADGLRPLAEAAGVRAAACVPLGHEVNGGFAIFSRERGRYERRDLPLLAEIGRCAERMLRPSNDPRSEIDSLLGGVHHDLATPLMAVRMSLDVMESALVSGGNSMQEHIDRARRGVDQMRGLLDELADYLRPHDGEPALRGRCTASAAVTDALDVLAPLAARRNLRLVTSLHDADAAIAIGRSQLGRVLSNIVGNAVKYTQAGGSIYVATGRSKRGFSFRVQDNGPGLSNEDRQHILDAEYVARSPIRRGNGLGLAIARRIVERYGGKIQVSSKLGVGTTFVISLPLAE